MTEGNPQELAEVDRFIIERIDTVPHLEALLIFWRDPSQLFSVELLAGQVFVHPERAKGILQDLARSGFIHEVVGSGETGSYRYQSNAAHDRLIGLVNDVYRTELIRVSRMIHSKPSAAVRDFARAFRLKKDI